jgi:hypothetical protein
MIYVGFGAELWSRVARAWLVLRGGKVSFWDGCAAHIVVGQCVNCRYILGR